MELITKRIEELHGEAISLTQERGTVEAKLREIDTRLTQLVGAINELVRLQKDLANHPTA